MISIIHRSWEHFRGTLPGTFAHKHVGRDLSGNLSRDLWEPFRGKKDCINGLMKITGSEGPNHRKIIGKPSEKYHNNYDIFWQFYGDIIFE